jgi:hypothetical protein
MNGPAQNPVQKAPKRQKKKGNEFEDYQLRRTSSKSIEVNQNTPEVSREEGRRQSTSMNYMNRSNYFNSMCSDKDFSKFDFDDREWIRKSLNDESQDESFLNDPVLPDKLATRLKTFMENDAQKKSLVNSEDEGTGQKMLEKGKEIVRKSGLEVDFSGKLVSKEMIRDQMESNYSRRTQNTSLDLGLSKENKFWLEQKEVESQVSRHSQKHYLNSHRVSALSKDMVSNQQSSIHDIQGITSTKYSDLYCQDNLAKLTGSNFDFVHNATPESSNTLTRTIEQKKGGINAMSMQSSQNFGNNSRTRVKRKNKSVQYKDRVEDPKKMDIRKIITYESIQSSKVKIDSIDYSGTDIFDNGSFLNMAGNDSLLIANETGGFSIVDSGEK